MNKNALLLISLILLSCSDTKQNLDQFSWMEGQWAKDSKSGNQTIENWTISSPYELVGYGLTSEKDDTIFYEKLRIISEKTGIYYVADVGNGPIPFKLTESDEDRWVFENPSHDFPKRIVYTHDGDWMTAYTEAEGVSIPFKFKKVK